MEDSRLVKEVVFGEMAGKTKRGRPRREWLDDIKEWCNEEIYFYYLGGLAPEGRRFLGLSVKKIDST